MKRFEGFLRQSSAAEIWPARWIVLCAELAGADPPDSAGTRRQQLGCWRAAVLEMRGAACAAREDLAGDSAGGAWNLIERCAARSGPTWIISPRALLAWQVFGLWEKLERGRISLFQTRGCSRERWRVNSGDSSGGLLLTSDPPTAAKLSIEESTNPVTWVCGGNFGISPLSAGEDSQREREDLAAAVLDCSRILSAYRLGGWAVTAGAVALKGWRGSWSGPALYLASGGQGDPLENRAGFGGRVLAAPTGPAGVTAYGVDARSMYPYVCIHYPVATDLEQRGLAGSAAQEAVLAHPQSCLAEVTLETTAPLYPCRIGGETVYPVGSFATVLAGPELESAVRGGQVRAVHTANTYRLGLPLAEYQRRVWRARQELESAQPSAAAGLIKRLGVSLIGKLAQRVDNWAEVIPDIGDPIWGEWEHIRADGSTQRCRARAGVTEVSTGTVLAATSLPSIPLWVWSWGRLRLARWIACAGQAEVIYADTDGLILTPLGHNRLEAAGQIYRDSLGMLRHVAGPCRCVVTGPKVVTLGDRVVCAGLPLRSRGGAGEEGGKPWFRLPWNQLASPENSGSWVERTR